MGKALYRKYRSKSLDEIVGQEHITKTLARSLKQGTISHAYLFTGPRGVGKTSIARILAHAVNDLPYDEEATHLDIIEIDAASNRRIEEIRDLRDKVHIAPTSGRYKVYIIDEVHMLTREAFNALLKTLEEPPAHVIFILATTEAHKLPETITSRTQRFTFKPIEPTEAAKHLRTIAEKEDIEVSDEALRLIAEHSGGSFRDSISLLDQARNLGKTIEKKDVENLLGLAPKEAVDQLYQAVTQGAPNDVVQALDQLQEQGFQAASIAKQLSARLRADLLSGQLALKPAAATALLAKLLQTPAAHQPDSYLELILLEPTLERQPALSKPVSATITEEIKPESVVQISEPATTTEAIKPPVKKTKNVTGSISEAWPTILTTLKQRHNTLYSIVRMAEPAERSDRLVLKFAFPFHQKRLNDAKHQQLLQEVIVEVTGQSIKLDCVVDKEAQPPAIDSEVAAPQPDLALDNISNIFGNTELLD